MTVARPVILLSGPEDDGYAGEALMRFRLTYDGLLFATQGSARPGQQEREAPRLRKHELRRHFHAQLRHFWQTNRYLSEAKHHEDLGEYRPPTSGGPAYYGSRLHSPLAEALADKYQKFGFRFVPLVRRELFLACSISILFLRRDIPGRVIVGGDIDNRIKTVIDALKAPQNPNELTDISPSEDEDPFYCLLEDDSLIEHIDVEADLLLDPLTDDDADQAKVRLIITVNVRPYDVTMDNLSFA